MRIKRLLFILLLLWGTACHAQLAEIRNIQRSLPGIKDSLRYTDALNRLVRDSASPANVVVYSYDALNRLYSKTVAGQMQKFSYSGALPIEERNAAGLLKSRTIFSGLLSPVMTEKNNSRFYYHANEIGSIEAVSNDGGRLIEYYKYDAFGKTYRLDSLGNPLASSPSGNRYGFTGQE
ncbi:MAG: hypothetical protein EOP54_31160, partial [Sphingobacteriales bacterium]